MSDTRLTEDGDIWQATQKNGISTRHVSAAPRMPGVALTLPAACPSPRRAPPTLASLRRSWESAVQEFLTQFCDNRQSLQLFQGGI